MARVILKFQGVSAAYFRRRIGASIRLLYSTLFLDAKGVGTLVKSVLSQLLLLVVAMLSTLALANRNKTLRVSGYPLNDNQVETDGPNIADHPIFGRLSCPSLTRLNLIKRASERVLLRRLDVSTDADGQSWILELKEGVRWWGGDAVSANDLAELLPAQIRDAAKAMSHDAWVVPPVQVLPVPGIAAAVKVRWASPPVFGPYVLNQVPLRRFKSGRAECAGEYRMEGGGEDLRLIPVATPSNRREIRLSEGDGQESSKADILFQFPKSLTASSLKAIAFDKDQCSRSVDLPIATLVSWNPRGRVTASADVRRAMTNALPRGALLRAGTALLGDLVSAPLLRAHPGYDRSLLVRPFDLRAAGETLDRLKFPRPNPFASRLTPSGQPLELVLFTPTPESIVSKVLVDSLNMLGIKVSYTSSYSQDIDGVLTGMTLPWPDANFLPVLHSRVPDRVPFWSLRSNDLDQALESYALSLTQERPDFDTLQKIHKILYDLEPFTVLVQHRTCLLTPTKFRAEIPRVIIRNPDWFYELING